MISHSKCVQAFRRCYRGGAVVVFLAGVLAALPCRATPVITSVSAISTQQSQTIVITGSGFGTSGPYVGDSDYISFSDNTRVWEAGFTGPCPFSNGCDGASFIDDAVTLVVGSWTDSSIVLGGLAGYWGAYNWTLANGDTIEIDVWNPQSGSGPATIFTTVGTASVAPEPAGMALFGLGLATLANLRRIRTRTAQKSFTTLPINPGKNLECQAQ